MPATPEKGGVTATISRTNLPSEAMPSAQKGSSRPSGRVGDLLFAGVTRLAAVVTLLLLVAIIVSLMVAAILRIVDLRRELQG